MQKNKLDNLAIAEFGSDKDRDLLLNDPDWKVREAVAKYGNQSHRAVLAQDTHDLVRASVVSHKDASNASTMPKNQGGQAPIATPIVTMLLFVFILIAFFSTSQ